MMLGALCACPPEFFRREACEEIPAKTHLCISQGLKSTVDGSRGSYKKLSAAAFCGSRKFYRRTGMFTRTEAILGKDNIEKLKNTHVVLAGCGGVGSYVLEALVRTGIGKITVIDGDNVDITNLNRQIIATVSTVGVPKVDAAKKRALDINPVLEFSGIKQFLDRDNIGDILPRDADYIVDAIDHVPAKVGLAVFAKEASVPIITCLGTGKRLDATKFEICDIFETSGCPLARKMRYKVKKAGIEKLCVIYSKSKVYSTEGIGSVAFVPSVAGLLIAQKVICDIIGEENATS